jgi:hypothetical protein
MPDITISGRGIRDPLMASLTQSAGVPPIPQPKWTLSLNISVTFIGSEIVIACPIALISEIGATIYSSA